MIIQEKRKFQRSQVVVTVQWKKITRPGERTAQHISSSKDVSLGGIGLVLHPGIQVDDVLRLDIFLPGDRHTSAEAKVIWVNPQARVQGRAGPVCEGGVEFISLSESDRDQIGCFLAQKISNRSHK